MLCELMLHISSIDKRTYNDSILIKNVWVDCRWPLIILRDVEGWASKTWFYSVAVITSGSDRHYTS
jgi:hypothetical protein